MAVMGGHGPILLSPLPLISGPQWPAGRKWVERGDPPAPPGSSLQLSCAAFCPCHRADEKEIRLWLEKVKQMR